MRALRVIALTLAALCAAGEPAAAQRFTELTQVTGSVVDATPDRVLYTAGGAAGGTDLRLRHLPGGAEETVNLPSSTFLEGGLVDGGFAWMRKASSSSLSRSVYLRRE